jgi:hypothetical protein
VDRLRSEGVVVVTVIDCGTGSVAVSCAAPLILLKVAVIVAVPVAATAVARPLLPAASLTVATAGALDIQVASIVISWVVWVVPSEKVPITVNCSVKP